MAAERIRYQKLPGQRRGLVNGSSVWLAPDHLLLVKSQRFKEEYKRFYLRDIQAIAVARSGRFHLSSRALVLALLWLVLFVMSQAYPRLTPVVWSSALVLVFAWLYISLDRSCFCRIYTAVSSDPLPSVYRTWTARRFLAAVEPRIRAVQGELDPAWAQAAGTQHVGPAPDAAALAAPPPAEPAGAPRTLASDIFLATLLFEAAADALAFSTNLAALTWVMAALAAVQSIAAIFVFIDRHRGRLRAGVHKVAIAKLVWLTIVFYIDSAYTAITRTALVPLVPANDVVRGIDLAIAVGLFAIGAAISWGREAEPPPSLLGN